MARTDPVTIGFTFAGDLYLHLARTGALVVDPDLADQVIEELEATVDVVHDRLRLTEALRRFPRARLATGHPDAEQVLVDAAFAEQVAPGRLEEVLEELLKYIEAFEIARRPPR